MTRFRISASAIDVGALQAALRDPRAGACASFEGWVRDHNDGRPVEGLHYEAYMELAQAEGAAILEEALRRFDLVDAACVHRTGDLAVGELAVWVGVFLILLAVLPASGTMLVPNNILTVVLMFAGLAGGVWPVLKR